MIDETTLIENDSSNNSLLQQSTRSRKQQIVINSDNENDSNQSETSDSITQEKNENSATVTKNEYDFDENEEISNDVSETEIGQKRLRGRPSTKSTNKDTVKEPSTTRESSPPRKSARIANKYVSTI